MPAALGPIGTNCGARSGTHSIWRHWNRGWPCYGGAVAFWQLANHTRAPCLSGPWQLVIIVAPTPLDQLADLALLCWVAIHRSRRSLLGLIWRSLPLPSFLRQSWLYERRSRRSTEENRSEAIHCDRRHRWQCALRHRAANHAAFAGITSSAGHQYPAKSPCSGPGWRRRIGSCSLQSSLNTWPWPQVTLILIVILVCLSSSVNGVGQGCVEQLM